MVAEDHTGGPGPLRGGRGPSAGVIPGLVEASLAVLLATILKELFKLSSLV